METNPILNSPYEEPRAHYATDDDQDRSINYEVVLEGRRMFDPGGQPTPTRRGRQRNIQFDEPENDEAERHIINLLRAEVGRWRADSYPNTTRVTRELLHFWFLNPQRIAQQKLFFAQQESVETAIWLNEVAANSNAGSNILRQLREAQMSVSGNADEQLPRIAFKMATGSGKTVVMAAIILYHFANRQEYKSDTRFTDYFLIVAPGVTIRDRLGVLFVDPDTNLAHQASDYYRQRGLVPTWLDDPVKNINSRLVITNYHSFLPKTLQGNKRSPFDGKKDVNGKAFDAGSKEDFSIVVKRILGRFRPDSRLLIINDEAHHCYLPRGDEKTTDNEEVNENERAAVWFTGIKEIAKRYKLHSVYDLSATPYYLSGSGYQPYSLFPWVVSDFGLIEAIESGLVKIPFLPESDDTQEVDEPVLKNLYEHVKDQLPRRGRKGQRKHAKEEGEEIVDSTPIVPPLVKSALTMFYDHYVKYAEGQRKKLEAVRDLFTPPPVFIVVCNNTSVSKDVYKYIAGYQIDGDDENALTIQGSKPMFSNYDDYGKPLKKPPTLLIDSDALENSDQINDEFKKVFAPEIAEFKKDYARLHGQGSVDDITDAQILREVVNTVGQEGKLGAHIKCVVSVSMLTEGWDANTVTHIMGIRAFGSQLLCEQVAGRALRRMSYVLQGYDKDGNPTKDKRKIVEEKFPPEYAHIIGVPFNMFKGGATEPPEPPPRANHIYALHERKDLEIKFPNVIGYRVEDVEDELQFDFSRLEPYEIDGSKMPTKAELASAISEHSEELTLESILEKRDGELLFSITKDLLQSHVVDVEGSPKFRHFGRLKEIVTEWYDTKVKLVNITDPAYRKLLYFHPRKPIADHIARGLNTHLNTAEFVRPQWGREKFGSTRYVNGFSVRPVYEAKRSHVNFVVEHSNWEAIAAKALDEIDGVLSYVKNSFLGFTVPYLKDGTEHQYEPDFLIRVTNKEGDTKNLILEVTGMNKDKAEKKWYVENRWLPAVNAVQKKYGFDEWHFIEVANDIRTIKNELVEKIHRL
jgi:type III restriction enzyme